MLATMHEATIDRQPAKQNWFEPSPVTPLPDLDYSGFPFWHSLLAEPNREHKAAEYLKRVNIHAYLPEFTKQQRCGRPTHYRARRVAVISCMLFVPVEMLAVDNRDKIMDWAGLRFAKQQLARPLTKSEIQEIRSVEARLNIRASEKAEDCKIGRRVRLKNGLLTAFLGVGTIIEVAGGGRVRVEMEQKLLGGKSVIWVSCADVEVMQPETAA
jgi:hypothetical protein